MRRTPQPESHLAATCPHHGHRLIPVFAVEDRKRRVVAQTCPEPYCEFMQMVPQALAEPEPVARKAE